MNPMQRRSFSLPDDEQVLVLERAAEFKAYKTIMMNLLLLFQSLGVKRTKNFATNIYDALLDVANVYDILIQKSFSRDFNYTTVRTNQIKKSRHLIEVFYGSCDFENEGELNKFQPIMNKYTEIDQFHEVLKTMKLKQQKVAPIPIDAAEPLITLMQDMLVHLDDLNNLPFSSVVEVEEVKTKYKLTTKLMPKIAKHMDEMIEFIQTRQESF